MLALDQNVDECEFKAFDTIHLIAHSKKRDLCEDGKVHQREAIVANNLNVAWI